MKKFIMLLVAGFCCCSTIMAQDDSTEVATKPVAKQKFTRATFKSTRIINMQSVEIVSKDVLQFMISHHFSYLWNKDAGSQNFGQLFGINSGVAHTYLSFDYSPNNWMNIGVAAAGSSRYEGWAKVKLLRQQTGIKNIPATVVWFSLANINTAKDPDIDYTWNKLSFLHQLLIARKFSDKLSLQVMPTLVHFNVVPYGINNSNFVYSLGMGGKYRLTDKTNLTFEYARQLNMHQNIISKNGSILNYSPDLLSVGMEINTGGHQFQFFVGSTTDASNIDQLGRNNSWIKDGHFAFGFTINRSMDLKGKEE